MATDGSRRLTDTRGFFGPRAAGWEDRFPDDEPRYRRAVAALRPAAGDVAVDVGCGTGRALPWLREAVGGRGLVVGVDVTPEMLAEAVRRGRRAPLAALVLADAGRLPLPAQTVDALFAAGLLPHLADPVAGLAELARVARLGAASPSSTPSDGPPSPPVMDTRPLTTTRSPRASSPTCSMPPVGRRSASTTARSSTWPWPCGGPAPCLAPGEPAAPAPAGAMG